MAEPLGTVAVVAVPAPAGRPPRPALGGYPFDAPVGGQAASLGQRVGSTPCLGRASLSNYLSRDEISAQVAVHLQERVR